PPADRKLRDLQAELRRAAAARRTSEQARLEAAIRARARLVEAADGTPSATPDVSEAASRLAERALVEYLELGGVFYALTLAGGKLLFHELGAVQAAAELDWLRFAYGRLAGGRLTPEQRVATRATAAASAAALDELLIGPLRGAVGGARCARRRADRAPRVPRPLPGRQPAFLVARARGRAAQRLRAAATPADAGGGGPLGVRSRALADAPGRRAARARRSIARDGRA